MIRARLSCRAGAGAHPRPRRRASARATRRYKVAWVGGCVLFDTALLRAAGGFDFWRQLPPQHCGEDVLAEQRVMARFGGCAIFPSGAYHMELPTTVTARAVDAPYVLPLELGPSELRSGDPPGFASEAHALASPAQCAPQPGMPG